MAQTILQRITTRWSWIKHYRMHLPTINEVDRSLEEVALSWLSKYHLESAQHHMKQAQKCIDRDVNYAKQLIRTANK